MITEKMGGYSVHVLEKRVTSNSGGGFGIWGEFQIHTEQVIAVTSKDGDYYCDPPFGIGRTGIDAWVLIKDVATGTKQPNKSIDVRVFYIKER
jgi:hypothetical protein